jgi:hypothetical protein
MINSLSLASLVRYMLEFAASELAKPVIRRKAKREGKD